MLPRSLFTENAPKPVGPYSQAVECGNLIFISGQIPLDPKSGEKLGETTSEQALVAIRNLKAILSSQGLKPNSLVKTTVFLCRMKDFAEFNEVYLRELEGVNAARSVIEVTSLPKDVLVEIEAIACR